MAETSASVARNASSSAGFGVAGGFACSNWAIAWVQSAFTCSAQAFASTSPGSAEGGAVVVVVAGSADGTAGG